MTSYDVARALCTWPWQKIIVASAAGSSDAAAIAAVQAAVTAICFAASSVAVQVSANGKAGRLAVLLIPAALSRCAAHRAAAAAPDITAASRSHLIGGPNPDSPDEEAADIMDDALAAGHLEIDRAFLKAARKVEPTSYMSEADYANAMKELERSAAAMHGRLDADAAKRREALRLRKEARAQRGAVAGSSGATLQAAAAAEEAAAAELKVWFGFGTLCLPSRYPNYRTLGL